MSYKLTFILLYNFGGAGTSIIELKLQINSASSILGQSKNSKSIFLVKKV